MKRVINSVKVIAVSAAALFFVACSGGNPEPTADNMVPNNAVAAVKVDAKTLWNKVLGEKGSDLRSALKLGKSMASNAIDTGSSDLNEIFKSTLNDPATLGIDLDEPVAISVAVEDVDVQQEDATVEVCAVALLTDREAFIDMLKATVPVAAEYGVDLKSDTSDKSYAYFACVMDDLGSVEIGVASEAVVIRYTYNVYGQVSVHKENLIALFGEGANSDSESLKAFNSADNDITFWLDFDGVADKLMPIMKEIDPASYEMMASQIQMYEGAGVVSSINFETGKTVIAMTSYGSDEMLEMTSKYYKKSSDKYFKYIPSTSFIVANIALSNLDELVEYVKNGDPSVAEAFEYLQQWGVDEQFLKGLPGQMTLALDAESLGDEIPGFVVAMECDENVYQTIAGYMVGLEDVVGLTYEDGTLLMCSELANENLALNGTFKESPYAKVIEKGGVVIDFSVLPSDLLDELAEEIDYSMDGEDLLDFMSSIVVTTDGEATSTITINMNDTETNFIAKVAQYSLVSMF